MKTPEQILKASFEKNIRGVYGQAVGTFEEIKGESGYDWVFEAMEEYAVQSVDCAMASAEKQIEDLQEVEKYIEALNTAREHVASQTVYKRWENLKQETKGTDDYEEYLEKVGAVIWDNEQKYIQELEDTIGLRNNS